MLVLASRSPQRRAILEQLGVEFERRVPRVEELAEGDPREVVVENALRKARAVQGELVLGATRRWLLDGRVYGKPADEAEARPSCGPVGPHARGLERARPASAPRESKRPHAVTKVTFAELSDAELEWYLGTRRVARAGGRLRDPGPRSRAGRAIEGDFWNVVGLPVPELLDALAPELAARRSLQTHRSAEGFRYTSAARRPAAELSFVVTV